MSADFRPVVIIPCRNHGLTVEKVLEGLEPLGLPVIVVDDGSDAVTREALDELAPRCPEMTLLRHEVNRGKGAALTTGLHYAEKEGYTHALQVDADGQHDLADAPTLLESAKRDPNALWSARPLYDESVPKRRLIGRYVTHVWVWIETLSFEIVDSMCGYRVYPIASTLAILKTKHVGQFMDFDTEIMVRLYWKGLRVRFVPSRVIYPEDGYSNFRMWEDNVRISKMHTRLCIESPLWWPARVKRLFRREAIQEMQTASLTETPQTTMTANERDKATHWMNVKERRGFSGMKLLWKLYRWGGRPLFAVIGWPVTGVFYLTGTAAKKASEKFLTRVNEERTRRGLPTETLSGLTHFRAFTMSMLDRLAAWVGDLTLWKDVDFADEESRKLLCEPPADGRGKLVLVSHLGVAEATRALAQHDRAVPVWALVYDEHAPRFKAMLEDVAPDASRHIIAVNHLGVDTAARLEEAIARGEWVAIAADRTPNDQSSRGSRTATASFLGHDASFPVGPFVLANLLKCDVVTLFAVRVGDKLLISCRPFASEIQLPRKTRDEALAQYASQWAKILEDQAVAHPYQWFNFYDFWHEDEKQ
ncbi:MAG: glycosyltransferase family 2 protein [Sutterella wadsworthensis]|nr:glycosyltransferase family 2 protein [Sutterella wadsworthensis]